MKIPKRRISGYILCLVLLFLFPYPGSIIRSQQGIGFGIHADPLIGWFTSDTKAVINGGPKAGFNFGLSFYKFFTDNYAFSTGLSLITAGGSLSYSDTIAMNLTDLTTVYPGNDVIYNIKYLALPLGLKLRSNQIGYITFFTDVGVDPKFVLGGNIGIPLQNIEKENADAELKNFNMGYHVTGGIEYSLGSTTAIVLGVNFDSNFIDITQDKGTKTADKILHKILGFRLGVNF